MYNYCSVIVNDFKVYYYRTKIGDTHKRIFENKTNSLNQYTANIYLTGKYALINEDNDTFHIYNAGDTSIDKLIEYEPNQIITEKVIRPGIRLCLEPLRKHKWERRVVSSSFNVKEGDIIIWLSEPEINIVKVDNNKKFNNLENKKAFIASLKIE